MAAADLISELRSLAKFLHARDAVADGTASGKAVQVTMAASFALKVSALKTLGIHDALLLTEALTSANLGSDLAKQIQEAIDGRLASADVNPPSTGGNSLSQTLTKRITAYLSKRDLEGLKDPERSQTGRLQILVDRFLRLGLTHADEQTVKWAVATLVVTKAGVTGTLPTYQALHELVQDFKGTLESSRRPYTGVRLKVFPAAPANMPADVYQAAYDADDPPVDADLPTLRFTAENHIPLRKNSALLTKGNRSDSSRGSGSGSGGGSGQGVMITRDQLQRLLHGEPSTPLKIDMLGSRRRTSPGSRDSLAFSDTQELPGRLAESPPAAEPSAVRPAAPLLALMPQGRKFMQLADAPQGGQVSAEQPSGSDKLAGSGQPSCSAKPAGSDQPPGSEAFAPGQPAGSGGPATRVSTEEYERKALAAILSRDGKRRDRDEAEDAAAPAAGKRAKAAAPQARKRPAAAGPPDRIAWVETDRQSTRATFVSKHYHRTLKAGVAAGLSVEAAKEKARAAYAAAGLVYDKKTGK